MLRAWCARRLECGQLGPAALTRPLGVVYGHVASTFLARPVRLPTRVSVIGIGGAVLGGAGKTAVALAYARACADAGVRAALVSHAYGARPVRAKRVFPNDPVAEVGDDALVAASALADTPVGVWVGPHRDACLAEASHGVDVIIVDGLLQARPERLTRSVLVLDGQAPFGSGVLPPSGDLRAPVHCLLTACDEVVIVRDPAQQSEAVNRWPEAWGEPRLVRTAWTEAFVPRVPFGSAYAALRPARIGLLLTIARPTRVTRALLARRVVPLCHWFGADHRAPGLSDLRRIRNLARRFRLDGWLTSSKCATHLAGLDLAAPIGVIQVSTRLDPSPTPVLGCRACAQRNSSWSC
ncbi:MAG: tetraacyldisaccharide 4'-kinase [Polyangiaceae bacterium]|nr:tetraacyldisaccharide 4'-kinase [Polyangiaceae bacterium]